MESGKFYLPSVGEGLRRSVPFYLPPVGEGLRRSVFRFTSLRSVRAYAVPFSVFRFPFCKGNNKNRSSLVFGAKMTKFRKKTSFPYVIKVFFVNLRLLIKRPLK